MNTNSAINNIFHGAVTAGLATAYAAASTVLLKGVVGGRPPALEFKFRDLAMLSADITAAVMTKDWLIRQGILPNNITTSIPTGN